MSATTRDSANARTRTIALIASLACIAAVGELCARGFERADHASRMKSVEERSERTQAQGGRELEGTLEIARANVRGIHNGVPFRTNAAGVRGPEFEAEPAPGVTRILVVGDSVTMGSGVPEEDAYVSRLAASLDRPIEAINGGLSGLNARAVMDRLERLDEIYAPDLIVYGFTINDIEGPAYVKGKNPAAVLLLWQKAARYEDSPSALVRQLWPRWVMLLERVSPTIGRGQDPYVRNYLEVPAAWASIEAALDRLAVIAERGDRCAAVLIHTHLKALDETHPYLPVYEKVGAAARARGLHVVPSFDAFAGRRTAGLWVGFLDPHPNREGHALLAAALAEGLRGLPLACWPDVGTSGQR